MVTTGATTMTMGSRFTLVYIGLHWLTLVYIGDREGIVVYGVPGDAGDTGDDNEDHGNNGHNGNDDGIQGGQ